MQDLFIIIDFFGPILQKLISASVKRGTALFCFAVKVDGFCESEAPQDLVNYQKKNNAKTLIPA